MKDIRLTFSTLVDCKQKLNDLFFKDPNAQFRLIITDWKKKRSLKANAQYHVWIPAISDFICHDLKTTELILKRDFGLPIIFADKQIGHRYGTRLEEAGYFTWDREKQIAEMEFTHVTSLMNTKQHNQMRDNILYFYNQAGLNIGYDE